MKLLIICSTLFMLISGDESANAGQYSQSVQPLPRQSQAVQIDAIYPPAQTQQLYTSPNSQYSLPNVEYGLPEQNDDKDVQGYSNSQTLENPSYDPNVHKNFVQDSVQEYVNTHGGPYPPSGGGSPYPSATASGGFYPGTAGGGGGFPVAAGGGGGPFPVGAPFPVGGPFPGGPNGYPGVPYWPPGFPGPAGLSLESGYEGWLVPAVPAPPPPPPPFGATFDIVRSMLPYSRTIGSLVMRSGTYLLGSLGVVLFGGAVTTLICAFTPFCSITFAALPFLKLKDSAKIIKEKISDEITTDRVKRAAEFVKSALQKYEQMQNSIKPEVKKEPVVNETTQSIEKE